MKSIHDYDHDYSQNSPITKRLFSSISANTFFRKNWSAHFYVKNEAFNVYKEWFHMIVHIIWLQIICRICLFSEINKLTVYRSAFFKAEIYYFCLLHLNYNAFYLSSNTRRCSSVRHAKQYCKVHPKLSTYVMRQFVHDCRELLALITKILLLQYEMTSSLFQKMEPTFFCLKKGRATIFNKGDVIWY